MKQNELTHHGVLGMRWGVRKARGSTVMVSGKRKRSISDDAKEVKAIKKKKVSQMSNSELRKANDRLNLEQNYSRLNPNKIKKGMAIVATATILTNNVINFHNNSSKLISIGKKTANSVLKRLSK